MATYKTLAVDNTTQYNVGNEASCTFSHEVAARTNRKLIVVYMGRTTDATAVTYAGESLTLAKESTEYDGCRTSIWYLDNPATGANNVVITLDGTEDSRAVAGVISIYHAKYGTVSGTDEDTGNASSITNSVNVSVGGSIVIDGQFNSGTSAGSIGAGQVSIASRSGNDSGGSSYKLNVSAGVTNMAWTGFNANSAYSEAVVVIEPAKQDSGAAIIAGII